MRHVLGVLFPLSLLALESPAFHADANLVSVDALVYERGRGGLIQDLQASDFAIHDEGQQRPVAWFGREDEPLDLVLALDVSGTIRDTLREAAQHAGAALGQLGRRDRVAILVFATRPRMAVEFTGDFAGAALAIPDALNFPRAGTNTDIHLAVKYAAEYLRVNARKSRRAILIVSDNVEGPSPVSDLTVENALYETGAVLNGIVVTGSVRMPSILRMHRTVHRFAEKSGGEVMEGPRPGERLAAMIERIRRRYVMQFYAPAGEGFHRLRVELSPEARRRYPRAIVRARAGYTAMPER